MSRPLKISLAVAGLCIVCLSLVLLAYAYWPVELLKVHASLPPALFSPP